jgi:hypothetical protein
MMGQFLDELQQTFPEEPKIKKYIMSYDLMRKANARKCVDTFMRGCTPHSDKIMAKDENFFLGAADDIEILVSLNMKKHWTPELSENTKNAIWQYVQTLYILGTTITSIPAETLSMIEDVASKCASNMQGGGDEKSLMAGMSGLFSQLGNMLEKK